MSIIEPKSLLSAPTGPLCVSHASVRTACRFSLVIPTYNECRNIANIVEILTGLLNKSLSENYELIIVDDDSPDGTWEVAQALIPYYPHLRVMRRQHERGLSSAVVRGWQVAQGDVVGVIDGDLQHPPEILLQLLRAVEEGADLAVASRHVDGGGVSSWSFIRRFLSRGAQLLGLMILPGVVGRVSDPMSGYFVVSRYAIAGATMNPVGYKILLEVLGRGKIDEIAEVGYVFRERSEGESKVTWKHYLDYIHHLLRLRGSTVSHHRFLSKFNFPYKRFIRFGIVGFSGVFVDLAVFHLLRRVLELGLTRSTILSAEVAIINNFLWNDLWTFGDVTQYQPSKRQRLKRFLKFNVVCLGGIILQTLLVNAFNYWGINEYIAKLMAIAIVVVWNFWVNLKLSWRVTDVNK